MTNCKHARWSTDPTTKRRFCRDCFTDLGPAGTHNHGAH